MANATGNSLCSSSHLDTQRARQMEIQALGEKQNSGTSDSENRDTTYTKIDFRKCSTFSSPAEICERWAALFIFCCLHKASDPRSRNAPLPAGVRSPVIRMLPSTPEQAKTTHYHILFPALCRVILYHILSLEYKDMPLLGPMQPSQMAISYKQEASILLFHWRNRQRAVPSSSPLLTSVHSETHIFTLLSLSSKLIGCQEKNWTYTVTGSIQDNM